MQMTLNNCPLFERAFAASMELIKRFEGKEGAMMIMDCMRKDPHIVAPIEELYGILLAVRAQDRSNIIDLIPSQMVESVNE